MQSAELFREIALHYENKKIPKTDLHEYLFYYYVKMNEALCLLRTNKKDYVNIAYSIYESLLLDYEDFTLLKMRYGQACGKLGYLVDALRYFDDAYNDIRQFEKTEKIFTDSMPRADYEHLKIHLPKVYGYHLWKKSEPLDANDPTEAREKLALLSRSYQLTKDALEINPELMILRNNMLYYAVTILGITKNIPDCESYNDIVCEIESHLAAIEESSNVDTCENIDTLDTLLKAYDILGKSENVLKIIQKIVPIAEKVLLSDPCDRDVLLTIQSEAIKLKMKYNC